MKDTRNISRQGEEVRPGRKGSNEGADSKPATLDDQGAYSREKVWDIV